MMNKKQKPRAPEEVKKILRNYSVFIRDFFKDLFDDRLGFYASSLSWNTIFSIIPLLVILLYVITTMPLFQEMYDNVQTLIFTNLMPTQSKEIMHYINTFIANSDKLGMVGVFYVTFAAIMFFKVMIILSMTFLSFLQEVF